MATTVATRFGAAPGPAPKGMVWIPGGTFMMGSDHHYPEEAPAHPETVAGFWMDETAVTNQMFRRFVKDTGYVTIAEQTPRAEDYPGALPEMLVPGSTVFTPAPGPTPLNDHYRWWRWQPGADWRHPDGPESNLGGRDREPVVHVALPDALAYAEWAGKSLPTEIEWERAARGGLEGAEFAWGDEFAPRGKQMANTWQGEFPWQNLALDGYVGRAPVKQYPPNQYGLFDIIGNVWEFTTSWYQMGHDAPGGCCGGGLSDAERRRASVDPNDVASIPRIVLKGGSHLCAPNYCQRYRPAARMHHPIDTGTNHVGFRCILRPAEASA